MADTITESDTNEETEEKLITEIPESYPKFEVRGSDIHGKGVYALEDIKKGVVITEYVGEAIDKKECDIRANEYEKEGHTMIFELEDGSCLDGKNGGNDSVYMNHSCDPNCESDYFQNRVFVVAIRDIKEGDELYYDYAFDKDDEHVPCRCGSEKCRGVINDLEEDEE
tara:strand:- start:5808 stop:6311 length:504 start_codon:yes stop_codon:yes gene_type:complete